MWRVVVAVGALLVATATSITVRTTAATFVVAVAATTVISFVPWFVLVRSLVWPLVIVLGVPLNAMLPTVMTAAAILAAAVLIGTVLAAAPMLSTVLAAMVTTVPTSMQAAVCTARLASLIVQPWPLVMLLLIGVLGAITRFIGTFTLLLCMPVQSEQCFGIQFCELGHERPQVGTPLLGLLWVRVLIAALVYVFANLQQAESRVVHLFVVIH